MVSGVVCIPLNSILSIFSHPTHCFQQYPNVFFCAQECVGCQKVVCILLYGIVRIFSHPTHLCGEARAEVSLLRDALRHSACKKAGVKLLQLCFFVAALLQPLTRCLLLPHLRQMLVNPLLRIPLKRCIFAPSPHLYV